MWSAILVMLNGCGVDPASNAAVPGAPLGNDQRPSISTIVDPMTSAPSTTAAATATTAEVVESTAPATTLVEPTTTSAPGTTVPATTDPAPTTPELVYVDELAEGVLRFGMKGPRSQQLQADLIALGHLPAGADDGLFGPGTAGGVRRFQETSDLVIDGVAGPVTLAALTTAIEALNAEA